MSKQTLATKYRPKTFNDVVEQTPIKMTLQEQLKTDTIKNCYLFTGGAGTGKAQPLYSKVLTPNGFIDMKDVEVGTEVIGCDGEVHNVTATYDRGTRDIYELTFNDNTKVRCCDEHLWNFLNNDYSQYTVELNALFNKPLCHNCVDTNGKSYDVWNYAVPIAKPTKFAEKAVTVPPYVLGFLIQEPKIDFENLSNYSIDITNKCIGDCDNYSYAFTGFLYNKICEDYSLDITANSENTFIPNDYKINSVENRIELISGMIDGIGFYANTTERDSFVLYTISSQLADDICFIVRSLGGYAEIINSTISCLPGYNVYVKFNDDIKLNLHNKEFYDYKSTNNIYKILENIEYIGKEPCKCIMIDSDEHLYITDGYTVTHNTTDARIFANEINKGIGSPIEMDAASNNSVEDVRKIIEDAKYKSMTGEYKVYIIDECHSLSNQAWQSLLKLIEEPPAKTIFIFCLEENGLVYTKKGMKKIKDVTTDDFVWTGDEFRPVSNVFNNGIRDCLKITLSNGEEIKCTGNHKLKVLDGTQEVWKCASDLTTNDVIAVYHSYDENEESVDLTDTECWFLGYLTGNGHYRKKSMEFFTPKHKLDYIHHKLDICISEGWLSHYEDVRDIGAVTTQIHFPYGTLLKWYDKTGCDYTYTRRTKSIPKCVYKMNKEQLESFVQGWYDADGSSFGKLFLSDIPHPQLYCSSKLMIQELQQLLLAKGYDARLYTSERNNVKLPNNRVHRQTSYCYSLVISHQSGYFKNSILKNWMYEHRLKECTPYIPEAKNLKRDNTQISTVMINKSQLKDLQGNKWYQNIKSIEPYGKCSVYDLEIPVVHEFIYNGVKVHNCTTDPQKIPNTILSRVQRYDFRKISFNGIINRLKYIIEQENKENANIIPTEEGLEYIAKLADGGMRDAITTLDKCISYNSNLTLENVITALCGVNYDIMFNLVDSTYNYDSKNVITIIEDIYNSGANIKQFIKDFSDFVLDLCKYGLINSFDYIRIPTLYSNKLSAYTGEHYGFFNQLLGEMIKLSNLIKWESSPKSTIESTFILLCQKG